MKRKGVSVVIEYESKILLIRRSEQDTYPGIYELPGGKVDAEETVQEAAIREIFEETGLKIEPVFLGTYVYPEIENRMIEKHVYKAYADTEDIVLDEREHSEYIWVDMQSIKDYKMMPEIQEWLISHLN